MRKQLFVLGLATVTMVACGAPEPEPEPVEPTPGLMAFTGARLIVGDGDTIEGGTMVVRDGRIEAVGSSDTVSVPPDATSIDLTGKTITPGLINAHGHVNNVRGLEADPSYYTEAHVAYQLGLYARYGVTTVVSLGGDRAEGIVVRDREGADLAHARLRIAGPVITADSPEQEQDAGCHGLA